MTIDNRIALRSATAADIPMLEHWDTQPHVIAATGDNPTALKAFNADDEVDYWRYELALVSPHYRYYVAELDGRPVGAMQIIDPHLESTHYWGEIEPGLRAIDIWIGEAADLGKGYGETMMRRAFLLCFADPAVTAIVIDPLASNVRAQRFYRRLGFMPEGRRTFGEDDCLVHRLTRTRWRQQFPDDAGGAT